MKNFLNKIKNALKNNHEYILIESDNIYFLKRKKYQSDKIFDREKLLEKITCKE
jgi:histone deacetylase complex regulatory component SIN3